MPRYIDIDKMNEWYSNPNGCGSMGDCTLYSDCKECYYDHGGAEEVKPIVHAKWDVMFGANVFYYCSNCCNKRLERTDYCPNCGAKMDKE